MSTFAVFGMTRDVALAEAKKKTPTLMAKGGVAVPIPMQEWLEMVDARATKIMSGTKVVQLSQLLDTPDFCQQFIELARKTLECRDMQIRARVQLWNDDGTPVLTKKRKHKVEWQQFGHQPGRAAA